MKQRKGSAKKRVRTLEKGQNAFFIISILPTINYQPQTARYGAPPFDFPSLSKEGLPMLKVILA